MPVSPNPWIEEGLTRTSTEKKQTFQNTSDSE